MKNCDSCRDRRSFGGPQLSRQSLFTHSKINFSTAKSIYSGQNPFSLTAIYISPRENHFRSRQNTFHHGKIIFIHSKIHFTAAKSIWLSCSRDISLKMILPWWNIFCRVWKWFCRDEIDFAVAKLISNVKRTRTKNRVPDGLWTHDPLWSSRML